MDSSKTIRTVTGPAAQPPTPEQARIFCLMAERYIWWKDPARALRRPEQIAAQVMNLGDWDDVQKLARVMGDGYLRAVLQHAEAGEFNARSWAYWHYRLKMAAVNQVPPLPARPVQ